MNSRDWIRILRKAKKAGKVVVFNFGSEELKYADPEWIVVNDLVKED